MQVLHIVFVYAPACSDIFARARVCLRISMYVVWLVPAKKVREKRVTKNSPDGNKSKLKRSCFAGCLKCNSQLLTSRYHGVVDRVNDQSSTPFSS